MSNNEAPASAKISSAIAAYLRFTAIGFGSLALVGAALLGMWRYDLVSHGESALGTVVDFKKVKSAVRRRVPSYLPVISFVAADGQEHVYADWVSLANPPEIGSSIGVIYDKRNPERATSASSFGVWAGVAMLACAGVFFILTGIFGKPRIRK